MSTININIRIEKSIKEHAEGIFNKLGINMTTAINMFLRTSIRENGIPFDLKLDVPNETTIEAIKEGKKIMEDPTSPRYSSMEDLKSALEI
ncbi:type II toxin-antitoxin system RelB/DinJ family antitoxin [uncultured Sneathia sp.]|uniref:type II toxin-antitoxin system RelB/DinJ family antitoxin n=1 Tax=uncultured Sneathia sp. TaxID=278067 RepID=UPI00259B4767|nr:type II toxin-antitoxin system RelB/DinJ family antitoxin [uncultured Sneathia sp.]